MCLISKLRLNIFKHFSLEWEAWFLTAQVFESIEDYCSPHWLLKRNNSPAATSFGFQKICCYLIKNSESDLLQIQQLSTHGETAVEKFVFVVMLKVLFVSQHIFMNQ